MTFEKALAEIKKGNKIKHKNWYSMLVEGFSENLIDLRDEEGWLHYFTIQEFTTAFGKLKGNWELVNKKK